MYLATRSSMSGCLGLRLHNTDVHVRHECSVTVSLTCHAPGPAALTCSPHDSAPTKHADDCALQRYVVNDRIAVAIFAAVSGLQSQSACDLAEQNAVELAPVIQGAWARQTASPSRLHSWPCSAWWLAPATSGPARWPCQYLSQPSPSPSQHLSGCAGSCTLP